jgi:menaquinone-9 beta-reductase
VNQGRAGIGGRLERADAVVVGARCAGSAAAIALARAGRRVVALDRVAFPADTISTHLLWPAGVAELAAVGALERVRAIGAPEMPVAYAAGAGHEVRTRFSHVGGIDYAMCVRRVGLDAALVATARSAGVEVREHCRVVDLVWRGGRVAGVRYVSGNGGVRELAAPLVIGADGRRSTVARIVGAQTPYRDAPSGRACFYAYWRDARPEWREVAAQWREGPELGTAFPCDDGLVLVLLQPPASRSDEFRGDLEGAYLRTIEALPGLDVRLRDAELMTKVRAATGIESYFRRSAGPGWALAGDAGHFKDPVTAQGIRDALRFGRLLGEAVAPVLDDAAQLDRVLLVWERDRERECLETYQWTNLVARGEAMTPIEVEMYRDAVRAPELAREMADVFSRARRPGDVLTARRALRYASAAAARHPLAIGSVARALARDVRIAAGDARERVRARRAPLPPLPPPTIVSSRTISPVGRGRGESINAHGKAMSADPVLQKGAGA